jgi:hypothetical protein
MLKVVWHPQGFFHIVDVLPRRAIFDIDYSCEDILSEIFSACPIGSSLRLIGHADNDRLHTSKRTREFIEGNNLRRAR